MAERIRARRSTVLPPRSSPTAATRSLACSTRATSARRARSRPAAGSGPDRGRRRKRPAALGAELVAKADDLVDQVIRPELGLRPHLRRRTTTTETTRRARTRRKEGGSTERRDACRRPVRDPRGAGRRGWPSSTGRATAARPVRGDMGWLSTCLGTWSPATVSGSPGSRRGSRTRMRERLRRRRDDGRRTSSWSTWKASRSRAS